MNLRFARVVWALCAGSAAAARADVQFLGFASIDGLGVDRSGLTNTLEDGSRNDRLDGFGSGIAYTGFGNRYVLLCDRGPNKAPYPGGENADYSLSFATRFQVFDIPVTPGDERYDVTPTLVATSLLRKETGENFVGLSSQFTGSDPAKNLRLDPESIRVAPDGTVYVSDEYGPNVYHFDSAGHRLGALAVPAKFQVASPNAIAKFEAGSNAAGRVPSKGMEGLAITPDGSHLLGALQAPLIQDGGDGTRYTRMILFDTAHPNAAPREYLYKLDADPSHPGQNFSRNNVCDVVAINDHQFLVDERDGGANQTKYAYTIDLTGAQDVSGIDSLASLTPAQLDAITPVSKSPAPLLDIKALVGNALNLVAPGYTSGIPDKVEGFSFGPDLPDGRHLLLVTNDDDFTASTFGGIGGGYPNYVMAFAIDPQDLANYQAEQFTAPGAFAPEPGGVAGLAAALTILPSRRRRRVHGVAVRPA